jgi:nicotinamidase-related amidase
MAITIDREHTALLAMDFENDIINENGAFQAIGFAKMVQQTDVLGKTARVLDAARSAGVTVIYVAAHFRPGHPEIPSDTSAGLFQTILQSNALVDETWGVEIDSAVAPKNGEVVVIKRGSSAFTGSDLASLLNAVVLEPYC